MPDSSGESPPSSQQPADAARPAAPGGAPSHLTPAPRLHPPSTRHSREPQTPPPPPGLNEVMEWLQRYGTSGAASTKSPDAAALAKLASRSLLSKEQRKFHKFDPEHPVPEPSTAGQADRPRLKETFSPDESGEDPVPFADYPGGITSEQIAYIRRLRQDTSARRLWLPLGVAVLSFFLVTAAFLAGHSSLLRFAAGSPPPSGTSEKSATAPQAFNGLSESAAKLIDQAATAEQTKDYPKAIESLEQAQSEAGHISGLNYHLAILCYKANEVARVPPLLNRSIADGEEVAACYSFRGTLSGQPGPADHGPGDLEKATEIDPFNARYLFVWGEALRRAGKPEQALEQFRRALSRAEDPAQANAYALKVRLTQIELGQQEQFAAEMATQLKLTLPPPDWLLTAAGVEMQRNNFPAAAEFLVKLRSLIGETATALQLQDPFFTGFAHEAELAKFFEAASSSEPSSAP